MTAYDVMRRLRGRSDECEALKAKIDMRRDAVTSITAAYGEKGSRGSAESDRYAAYAAAVTELTGELDRLRCRWQQEMDYCLRLVDRLTGPQAKLLYLYYGKSWTVSGIAKSEGYTDGYVKRVKRETDEWLRGIFADEFD